MLKIGCIENTFDWWIENYKEIGKKENYSDGEISEYYEYIKLFKAIGK